MHSDKYIIIIWHLCKLTNEMSREKLDLAGNQTKVTHKPSKHLNHYTIGSIHSQLSQLGNALVSQELIIVS